MERSPGGASPSSMNLSTFLGGSSPSPGGSGGNYYANYSGNSGNTTVISNSDRSSNSVQYGTSMSIRHEIQRFESVHPSIYAIYDLIELIPDQLLSQQIREHVVCIEDSFVNSQEWTLSRGVPDIRLGIVGSLSSGKSALVHRYLTGSYMQEESPEGGRFKKEVVVDGQSYLLLIRDEGGPPELQFTSWVDAVIFVFSLENETSFNAIYNYYAKMSQYRNMHEIPLILVGTQDAISENQPRVIDDSRARKLAVDLKRCAYYETCATYGLNVERVFQDACQKLTTSKSSRPTTPNHYTPRGQQQPSYNPAGGPYAMASPGNATGSTTTGNGYGPGSGIISGAPPSPGFQHSPHHASIPSSYHKENRPPIHHMTPGANNSYHTPMYHQHDEFVTPIPPSSSSKGRGVMVAPPTVPPPGSNNTGTMSSTGSSNSDAVKFAIPASTAKDFSVENKENNKDLATPSSTPTTSRKSRRRSNLFTPSKKNVGDEGNAAPGGAAGVKDGKGGTGESSVGSGRSIPIRQGILYKKSNKATFSKDWKKKYVTLCDDGRMAYHPSLNDYMSNVHGKEIPLQYVTVKVPGQKPRGSRTVPQTNPQVSGSNPGSVGNNAAGQAANSLADQDSSRFRSSDPLKKGEKVTLTGYEMLKDPMGAPGEDNNNVNEVESKTVAEKTEATTPNVKKRHHRRMKSNGVKVDGVDNEQEQFEFHIVSLDNKQWHFEAASVEERDEWVQAIEQQILNSLQRYEPSSKGNKGHRTSIMDLQAIKTLKSDIPGNKRCVDCDVPNPDWASINLGVLICIECSGVHRKLGSHISRVRSLDLDEWPPGHLAVMSALGNALANNIWENKLKGQKPDPTSTQEDKERFIMAKYNNKEFLAPLPPGLGTSASLVDAICRSDMKSVALVLAHASQDDVNSPVSPRDSRTPLHLAASLGNLAMAQLLIWSNANVKSVDHEGRTCISYARNASSQELVDLLLNNGCPDVTLSGTLPRRKNSISAARKNDVFDKVTSSIL